MQRLRELDKIFFAFAQFKIFFIIEQLDVTVFGKRNFRNRLQFFIGSTAGKNYTEKQDDPRSVMHNFPSDRLTVKN